MATHLGSSIDISDLDDVLCLLTAFGFSKKKWHELGLRLGLLMNTLDEIEVNHPNDVSRCLTGCLDKWLRRADNVNSRGGATWDSLSDALKSINEVAVANKLQCHLILTIFESHHTALSESLSDPINVAWLLHGERMITREVVNGVESASPSIPKQREVLLAAIKEVLKTEPNHLQRFATALSKFATTCNLSLASAIQVDINKYFPPPEVGITSNTDEPPLSTPLIPSPSISPFPSTSPPSISSLVPSPSISPPIASLSVLSSVLPPPAPAPSVLPPSQMPITSSDAEFTTTASSKPAPPVHLHVPIKHRDNFNSIRISYGIMFYEVKKIFEKNSPPLNKIKELLCFCSDRRHKVDSCTDIVSILRLIQDECSLTDVKLLACVVGELKITEAEELIINYKKELKEFCCSVKVDLCFEKQFDSIHHLQCELAIFELDWKPEEHMLQHIEDILSKVCELLGIKRIKLSNSISVICSFPLSLVGFVLKMIMEKFHILIHHGLKKLTIGNVIIWRRQDVREKELREKKPDTLHTEFISFFVLQKAEYGLNEAIDSKEKEIVKLKQELYTLRHLNEEKSMPESAQSDTKLMTDVEENSESMSEELVELRSHCSDYKKSNNSLADNLRKMEIEYSQSLSSHKNTAASKMRDAMNCEINDLKFCLKVMDGPDYRPLEIERLQEELSLVGYQLITERQNKELSMKKINETREKLSHCPSSVTEQEHSQVVINKHSTSTDTSKASPREHKEERPKEQVPSCNTTLEQEVEIPGHTFGAPIGVATDDYYVNDEERSSSVAQQSENSQYVIKNLEMIAEMQNKLECGLLSKNQPPHPIYYYTFPKTLMEGIYGNESNYQRYEQSSQNYDIEFVDPPPYECRCPLCLEIFKDKVCFQTKCCGNHICSECTTRHKNMKSQCVVCSSGSFDVTEDQFFTRQIQSLKVRCYYSNAGCKWTGELRQLDEHEKKCTRKIANEFKDNFLLKSRHCSVIWPSIVLMGGLPGANKSVILQDLLTRYVRQTDGSAMTIDKAASSKDMEVYEIVAIGNKHQALFWSEVTKFNCHNFCIASAILHDCDLDKTVLHLVRDDAMSGTFSNEILDEHFHTIYADLLKQEIFKPIDNAEELALEDLQPTNFWSKFLPDGLLIMNFWDVGFNNEITHILNAFSGHFCNCYPCLFLDLKRDEKLFVHMDESEYTKRNFMYSWWPRIMYLLQCALFAKPNEMVARKCRQFMNMSKSCLIVAVHNGNSAIDVPDKIKRLRRVLELVSEQMGLADILDFNILEFNMATKDSYRALKSRLERRITNEHIDFPSKWIFLRSAFYKRSEVYIERKEYESMASECNIDSDEFESFLTTFTASGSLIYAADMLPEYVILKPLAFLTKLAKIFRLTGNTEVNHGIVSPSAATEIFGDDVRFYTTVVTSLHLAIHLDIDKLDRAASTIMLNKESSIYFVPALRHSNPITECHSGSLHVFINFDVVPKCTEVLLIKFAFEVFPKHDLMITLTPRKEMNVIQFVVSSGQDSRRHMCWFELVYHGNSFEIRLHVDDVPEEVCQVVCCAILATFQMTFEEQRKQYGLIKFDFGFVCCSAGVRHYLPGFTSCTSCTPNPHLKQWTNAIEQAFTGTDYSLCKNPLLLNEMIKIADYIVSACDDIKLEELARKLNKTFDSNIMIQRGKMMYVMQMLIEWVEEVDMPRIALGQIMTELELHELAAAVKLFV